jgi:hypothetical protein
MSKRPIPVAGAIVTAVLVILFGNPPFVDWIGNPANVSGEGVVGFLLKRLTWPQWKFTPSGAGGDMAAFVAYELRAILIIALVFGILTALAKGIGSGGVGFLVGWVSVILAAGLASFITYFIANIDAEPSALDALAAGGTYGLFVGWIVGIFTGVAKRG